MTHRRRALLALVVLAVAGCSPGPAPLLSSDCEPRCLRELDVRVHSNDALVTAPNIWKFYDDFAARLPPACAPDGGPTESGLRPLWRRTIIPIELNPEYAWAGRDTAGRSAIDFHPDAGLAVSVGGVLWILDPETGEPRHILRAGDERHLPSGLTPFDTPIVAFAPDGRLWTSALGPVLLNLDRFDRVAGPYVEVSWHGTHADQTFIEGWTWPSKSVGRDGTLFWRSGRGVVRALEPSGNVRWEQTGVDGFATLDGNDNSWWSNSAVALRAADGSPMWVPQRLADWPADSFLPNTESQRIGNLIPATHNPLQALPLVGLHRVDGSLAGVIPDISPTETAMGNETLYVWSESPAPALSAWNTSTFQLKWSLPLVSNLAVGPVVSPRGNSVWLSTFDCRISEVGETGAVTRWHQMAGRPSGMAPFIANGILYVLSRAESGLARDIALLPGMALTQADAGYATPTDYGCYEGEGALCGRAIAGSNVFYLYAYRIE